MLGPGTAGFTACRSPRCLSGLPLLLVDNALELKFDDQLFSPCELCTSSSSWSWQASVFSVVSLKTLRR
eukprot:15036183-Alexandrium_andersonii.AAC.1